MAITYVGQGTGSGTFIYPSGSQPGDLIIGVAISTGLTPCDLSGTPFEALQTTVHASRTVTLFSGLAPQNLTSPSIPNCHINNSIGYRSTTQARLFSFSGVGYLASNLKTIPALNYVGGANNCRAVIVGCQPQDNGINPSALPTGSTYLNTSGLSELSLLASNVGTSSSVAFYESQYHTMGIGAGTKNTTLNRDIAYFTIQVGEDPVAGRAIEKKYLSSFVSGGVSSPNNAIGPNDLTYTTDTGSTSWTGRWNIQPLESNKSLVGLQRIAIRAQRSSTNSSLPTLGYRMYRNGVLLFDAASSALSVYGFPSSNPVENYSYLNIGFIAEDYPGITAENLSIEIIATAQGGGPSNRNTIQIEGAEFDFQYIQPFPPITGTLSSTEQNKDTASGTIFVEADFMRAIESGSDSASASGSVEVSGSVTAQELGKDTSSASGSVEVSGSVTAQELGQDDATFTGNSTVAANLAVTEQGADTANGTGSVLVSGSLGPRESGGKDDATASGIVDVSGSLATTESPDTFSASGVVDVSGSLTAQELGQDDATFAGTVEPKERHLLQANAQNISTTTSSVSIARLLVADLMTRSEVSSSVAVNKLLQSSFIAQTETSSDLIKDSGLQTSFDSTSSIEANIFKDISIESSAFAESSVSADILNELNLSATFESNSISSSSLAQQINVFLQSEIISNSQTTSAASVSKPLDSSIFSVAITSAELDKFVTLDSDAFTETAFASEVQKSSLMASAVENSNFFLSDLSVGDVVLLFSDNNASEVSVQADLFKQVEFFAETSAAETTTTASLNIQVILDSEFIAESASLSEASVSKPINASLEVSGVSDSELNLLKQIESFAAIETSTSSNLNLSIEFESSLFAESQSSAAIDLQNRLNSMIISSSDTSSFVDLIKDLNSEAISISEFESELNKEVSFSSNLLSETAITTEILNRLRLSSSFSNNAISQSELTKNLSLDSSVSNISVSSSFMKLNKPFNSEISSQINFNVPNLVFPIRSFILNDVSFNSTVSVAVNQVEVLRRSEIDVEYPVEKRLAYFTSRR